MKRVIVAGKGGAGKTTISAAILSFLMRNKTGLKIYILDADPASTLAGKLGWTEKIPKKGIGELKTEISESDMPEGYTQTKTRYVFNRVLADAISKVEKNGNQIAFSYMGHHQENSCMCAFNTAVNTVLMQFYNNPDFDYILVDREAGLEHINRSVYGEENDILLVVTWPSGEYIEVAKKILDLSDALGSTKNRIIVMNSVFHEGLTKDQAVSLLEKKGIVDVPVFVFPFSPEHISGKQSFEDFIGSSPVKEALGSIVQYIENI